MCYTVFKQHGFEWGGDWKYSKDYQHFEKVVDNTTAWDYSVVEESVDESGESASYAVLAYTTKDAHGNNVSAPVPFAGLKAKSTTATSIFAATTPNCKPSPHSWSR